MIVGTTVEGSPNTFLCKGPFGDFELEFDVLCDKPLNSGVQIRSHVYEKDTPQPSNPKRIRKAGEVYGYQCEIAEAAKGVSGNFWDEGRHTKWWDDFAKKPEAAKAYKDGEWNHYRIVAQGDHIRSWVNGVPCADFRDKTDASGFIGLQVHGIKAGEGPVPGPLEEHPPARVEGGRESRVGAEPCTILMNSRVDLFSLTARFFLPEPALNGLKLLNCSPTNPNQSFVSA